MGNSKPGIHLSSNQPIWDKTIRGRADWRKRKGECSNHPCPASRPILNEKREIPLVLNSWRKWPRNIEDDTVVDLKKKKSAAGPNSGIVPSALEMFKKENSSNSQIRAQVSKSKIAQGKIYKNSWIYFMLVRLERTSPNSNSRGRGSGRIEYRSRSDSKFHSNQPRIQEQYFFETFLEIYEAKWKRKEQNRSKNARGGRSVYRLSECQSQKRARARWILQWALLERKERE